MGRILRKLIAGNPPPRYNRNIKHIRGVFMKQDFCLVNYHTHTTRCMHASGSEEEYIQQAIASGYDVLGFADHTPIPYKSDFVARTRMPISQLEEYIASINALKEKYAGCIEIHVGLEGEAFPEYYDWMRDVKEKGMVEYLILGNHFDTTDENGMPYFGYMIDRDRAYRYLETTLEGMQQGIFEYLCHPDLFLNRYPEFDKDAEYICREICKTARQCDLPLEYNILGKNRQGNSFSQGGLGYSTRQFWEIAAEYGNRAIIGVDAHKPEQLDCVNQYIEARDMLKGMGIEVMDMLPRLDKA